MTRSPRVIGAEHIADARQNGRQLLEILPGDIVTQLARESAESARITLVDGPLEKPAIPRTDGAITLQRSLYRRNPKWIAPKPSQGSSPGTISRLALIGAGGVGLNIAHLVANRGIANEVALIDVAPGVAEAAALDLNHASGITRSGTHVQGSTDLSLIADAQVVVITAGRPRSPGMSRADLMTINRRIIQSISESVRTHAPDSIVIVVTNPLDEMTMTVLEGTGFPYHRVLGMAGTLDSSRFRWSLAQKAGVPVSDVEAVTLGSHGGEMVPIVSTALIRNKPVTTVLSDDEIRDCVETTVHGGESVVALRKTGSATLAPAHAVCELLDAIRGARPGALPVSVMLNGSYGIHDVVLGVPCVLDSSGLREIIELSITDEEQVLLEAAAESVRNRLDQAANTNI